MENAYVEREMALVHKAFQEVDEKPEVLDNLLASFESIQQPRPPFVLRHFVVNQHDTEAQQWAQCVLEMQVKYGVIRRGLVNRRKMQRRIRRLEWLGKLWRPSLDEALLVRIDLEEQDLAMLGAMREFMALYDIYRSFNRTWSREELNMAQDDYWQKRLTRQANQDLLASGRVGVGNQEALRQIGRAPMPQLDQVRDVERRFLDVGDQRLFICVATEQKAEKGLPCLDGVVVPAGCQYKIYNVFGREVAEAYNHAAQQACEDGAHYIFTVEDDTFPPPDALHKLLKLVRETKGKVVAGGWYRKRSQVCEGVPIVLRNGLRTSLDEADGSIREVYTLPMGCTLIPTSAFAELPYPWFSTTPHLTCDSFFSQLARDAGYKLLVDTSIKCKHIDRVTGEVYD